MILGTAGHQDVFMVDIGSIQAALGSLKIARDIAGSMKDLSDAAKLQSLTIDLQQAILDAQSGALNAQMEQASLIDQVRALEEEMARLEAWNTEKEEYELTDIGQGCLAFTLKDPEASSEPDHKLCANCFNHGEKSFLQSETRSPGRVKYAVCHGCGAELILTGLRRVDHKPTVITRRPRSR